MNTCKTCQYNITGSCILIGDGPAVLYAQNKITPETKPRPAGKTAFTIDADHYHSELCVFDDFCCNQYVAGKPLYTTSTNPQSNESDNVN